MHLDSIWSNIFKKKGGESEEALAIRHVPIFEDLPPKDIKQIESMVHKRDYSPSEHILREGDPGGGMYIILHGSVDIISGDGTDHEKVIATLKEGDFFGELALLDELPRSASAVSTTNSNILGFYRTDLQEFIDRKPKLAVKILANLAKVISERLRYSTKQSYELRKQLHGANDPPEEIET